MKQLLTVVGAMLTIFAMVSCSGDSGESLYEMEQARQSDFNGVIPIEELFSKYKEDLAQWQSSDNGTETRAASTIYTVYGCSSQESIDRDKYLITSVIANALGIPRAIYVAEYVKCIKNIHIEGLGTSTFFSPQTSPLCGLDPTRTDYTRGYNSSTPDANGNIILTTYLVHIISDTSGQSYNMWYPCSPTDIQWKYCVIQ